MCQVSPLFAGTECRSVEDRSLSVGRKLIVKLQHALRVFHQEFARGLGVTPDIGFVVIALAALDGVFTEYAADCRDVLPFAIGGLWIVGSNAPRCCCSLSTRIGVVLAP